MKEKTKKILNGVGLSLGAVALLCIGVGVGACSVKYGSTQPITTTPVRKGLRQTPKKRLDISTAENLMEKAYEYADGIFDSTSYYNYNANWKVYAWEGGMPSGVYYYDGESVATGFKVLGVSNETSTKVYEYSYLHSSGALTGNNTEYANGARSGYFYYDAVTYPNLFVNTPYWDKGSLYLVDAIDLPASSSLFLGENWNPLKAFGDNLSPKGGYLIRNQSWTYGTYTLPTLTLRGLVFKYEGEIFDRINITLWPMNATHTPYLDSSGNVVNPSENSGNEEIYALQSVTFSQSFHQVGVIPGTDTPIDYGIPVLSASRADTPVGGKYPYNGSVIWASGSRTIEILEDKATTGTRFDGRFVGMTDFELVQFLSQYQSEPIQLVSSGGVFEIISGALTAVFPLLAIQVLPNITLGLLLMLPLIGAIVVLIIKAVKK